MTSKTTNKVSPEVRTRAVQLVLDHEAEHRSRWAAVSSIAGKIGCTALTVPDERVFELYNRRGTAEQYIKEGKYALKWTRLSCKSYKANEVRLQLHALAYNMANFLRTLVLPKLIADWSLTSLRDRMIKIGTKAVRHARSIFLQLAEVAVPQNLWSEMLATISDLKAKAQAP